MHFYDSNTGRLLFSAPSKPGRSMEDFLKETRKHGWPSFRDNEVCWKSVRVLRGGEVVSIDGTHLGHDLPDYTGNRYCINLASIAGRPRPTSLCPLQIRVAPAHLNRQVVPPNDPYNHYVLQENRTFPPYPDGLSMCWFAAGCFWGVEKGFWRLPGIYSTAVGFIGGHDYAVDPSHLYVSTGESEHCEAVQAVWDERRLSFADLLRQFWACHDPTQGDQQGRDKGSQYRSGIFCTEEAQAIAARASMGAFSGVLHANGYPDMTTEIRVGCPFYFAEPAQQQHVAKPCSKQYCSAEPTGLSLPAFDAWTWPPELQGEDGGAIAAVRERFKPQLPERFWRSFDGSLSAPQAPAGTTEEAMEQAEEAMRRRASEQVQALAEAERGSLVMIQHCASCGYARRASELAVFLRAHCGGMQASVVPDVSVTGSFDVRVRASGSGAGTFSSDVHIRIWHGLATPLAALLSRVVMISA
mmetsp:Transcript_44980/g.143458  ORF Transcript_44980/g.143458 Transcript_44980/m.143458 type:complete len:469 (+) Transcript_44980:187-1593(+)